MLLINESDNNKFLVTLHFECCRIAKTDFIKEPLTEYIFTPFVRSAVFPGDWKNNWEDRKMISLKYRQNDIFDH